MRRTRRSRRQKKTINIRTNMEIRTTKKTIRTMHEKADDKQDEDENNSKMMKIRQKTNDEYVYEQRRQG